MNQTKPSIKCRICIPDLTPPSKNISHDNNSNAHYLFEHTNCINFIEICTILYQPTSKTLISMCWWTYQNWAYEMTDIQCLYQLILENFLRDYACAIENYTVWWIQMTQWIRKWNTQMCIVPVNEHSALELLTITHALLQHLLLCNF